MADTPETSPMRATCIPPIVGVRFECHEKQSILAVFPQLRRFALRSLLSLHRGCFSLLGSRRSIRCRSRTPSEEKAAEPSHNAGWVVIPVEEYRVLRAKAYPVEHDPEPPPLDATLTRVDYDLHVTGDLAAGTRQPHRRRLERRMGARARPSGLLVREARLDGKSVSLVPSAKGKGRKPSLGIALACGAIRCCCSMWTCRSLLLPAMRAFPCPPRNPE